ncbi:serine protein kinase RIO [Candidatus Woesearchaeota archaeon]|nr:serine protein kinase RIO [Candidatus Woesearchaeota archaeon]
MQSKEKFKTAETVFDASTLRVLHKLRDRGYFDALQGPISVGKESNIFSAFKDGKLTIAIKIYRVNNCDFRRMYLYIKGDPRFTGLQSHRRKVVFAWAQREYRNLHLARDAGVNVPMPHAVMENVLVMELVGKKGVAAQKLKDSPPEDSKDFSEKIILFMRLLHSHGIVHGDLSEYNILNFEEKPVLIDFSHGVKLHTPYAEELLKRDVHNIYRYFKNKGVLLDEDTIIKKITQ